MTERDPKIDPRTGDVFIDPSSGEVFVVGRLSDPGRVWWRCVAALRRDMYAGSDTIEDFREWAASDLSVVWAVP